MSAPTTGWIVVQSICPHISGALSMMGSSWIIFEVVRDKKKMQMFYHRLLLSVSIIDVMTSFWYFLSTWAAPVGHIYGAAGNQQTCTAQGFFQQIGIAIPIYNMWLIIYYFCILKFNWRERQIRQKFEPWVHVTALTYAFGTAFAGLGLRLFNPSWIWCWLEPYPWDCEQSYQHGGETTCIRGDNAYIYQYAFFVIIPYITIFVSIVMFALTYRLVRKQENTTIKWSATLAASNAINASNQSGPKKSITNAFRKKSKAVKETASLYLFFFFITWSPTFSSLILKHTVKSERGQKLAQEINGLFIAFLLPLQGFFNVVIYIRPRYTTLKKRMGSGAFIAAFKRPFQSESADDGDEFLGTGNTGSMEEVHEEEFDDEGEFKEKCDDEDKFEENYQGQK